MKIEEVKFKDLEEFLSKKARNTPETSYNIRIVEMPTEVKTGKWRFLIGKIIRTSSCYVSLSFDDTISDITNAYNMFQNCTKLTSIDTSPFIKVIKFSDMFCYSKVKAYFNSESDHLYRQLKKIKTIIWEQDLPSIYF